MHACQNIDTTYLPTYTLVTKIPRTHRAVAKTENSCLDNEGDKRKRRVGEHRREKKGKKEGRSK